MATASVVGTGIAVAAPRRTDGEARAGVVPVAATTRVAAVVPEGFATMPSASAPPAAECGGQCDNPARRHITTPRNPTQHLRTHSNTTAAHITAQTTTSVSQPRTLTAKCVPSIECRCYNVLQYVRQCALQPILHSVPQAAGHKQPTCKTDGPHYRFWSDTAGSFTTLSTG